ncbi:hypothetical protein B0H17DRAFT_1215012 [Mycena rosella]|uniref:Uncharacterized protein n=1 Tax=Mycena rosella TaxID=1033263 RepID=A0AAD7CLS0_MYCRO|nr:hypothetical protein B0H17DRAFT_1215012 [Mycena rosella]
MIYRDDLKKYGAVEIVSYRPLNDSHPPSSTLRPARNSPHSSDHVQHLCVGLEDVVDEDLQDFISSCPQLFDLVVAMPLQRLCIELHISSTQDRAGLALLPSLTHLAFNDEYLPALRDALETCKLLCGLVLLCDPHSSDLITLASDLRFVVVGCASIRYRQDWQRGTPRRRGLLGHGRGIHCAP